MQSIFSNALSRAVAKHIDLSVTRRETLSKVAINRYFDERNSHFKQHPRRAGKKIWRKEREPAEFSPANNCKDPRYR